MESHSLRRPLAPAKEPSERGDSFPENPRKRQKVSMACNECKARRTKCTPGPEKCERCAVRSMDCVYDTGADRRKRGVGNREELEKVEHEHQLLLGVFAAIRACPKSKLQQLMDLIRSDVPFGDVASYLHEHPESVNGSVSQQDNVMSIHSLVDQPPLSVQAKPWTTVTNDNYVVSHLLSLYFTWSHIFFVRFDKELFLRDMVQGRSAFCSPLLVNAILAHAAHMCGSVARRGYPDGSKLGAEFSAEARRLWQLEASHRNITTVQALLIMNATSNGEGKDQLGWMYLTEAVRLSLDMQLHNEQAPHPAITAMSDDAKDMQRSRCVTAWGLFCWQNIHNFVLQKENFLQKPPSIEVPRWEDAQTPDWVPYPSSKAPTQSHSNDIFRAQCSLAAIASDVSAWLFEENNKGDKINLTFEQALQYRDQLHDWKDSLPAILDPREAPLPHTLLLAMHYDDILIAIFKPFIKDTPPGPTSMDTDTEDYPARKLISNYIRDLKEMISLYSTKYGWAHSLPYLVHKLAIVAFHELENLRTTESRSSLISSVDAIRQMARSWFVAKPVLRMVELFAETLEIKLPMEVYEILKCLEEDPWVRDGVGQVLKIYCSGYFPTYFYGTKLEDLVASPQGTALQSDTDTVREVSLSLT